VGRHLHRLLWLAVAAAGSMCGFSSPATAATTASPALTWVTDGSISSIMRFEHRVYIGGAFTYVGPVTGAGAPLNRRTGARPRKFPQVWGDVYAAIPDGVGGYFVGGSFSVDRVAHGLAHVRADGSVDQRFRATTGGQVYALARRGTTLWIGGDFAHVNGAPRDELAAVDVRTGALRSVHPDVDSSVHALAVSGHTLYLGGRFDHVGGQVRRGFAALDARSGVVTTWSPYPSGSGAVGESLATWGNAVYTGGFEYVNDEPRGFIAAFASSATSRRLWKVRVAGIGTDNDVHALAASKAWLYAGGDFSRAAGHARGGLVRLDRRTGALTGWRTKLRSVPGDSALAEVDALALGGSALYVGGTFGRIGGAPRTNIAALSAATGRARAWHPGADGDVGTIAASGATVYAGGSFDSVAGWQRSNIAVLDTRFGTATRSNPDANGPVEVFAVRGSRLYVGGAFTRIGGHSRHRLAALDGDGGEVTAWNPNADGPVYAFAVAGLRIYAGGAFSRIGGIRRERLAALGARSGRVLGWNPGANGDIRALAVSGARIYAGGSFDRIGSRQRTYVAVLDRGSGRVSSWNARADFIGDCDLRFGSAAGCDLGGGMWALAVASRSVYVGGVFTEIGGRPLRYLAAVEVRTGRARAWDPEASDVTFTLARSGSLLWAGGSNGVVAYSLRTGQATSWWAPLESVSAIAVSGSQLYVGATSPAIDTHQVFEVYRLTSR
jgi:hypothetical protein